MNERTLRIPTSSGTMEAFATCPSENGPFPPVVIYMDFWGLREELFDIARRVATVGYYCIVPDLYYRQGRVRNEFRDEQNRMISFALLEDARKEIVLEPLRKLTDEMVIEDTGAMLDFIDRGEPVRSGPIGCIGYCMGGRHVFRVAGHFPQRFKASASLHGSLLVTDQDDSPHFSAARAQGELYCGFAEKDKHAQPEFIKAIENTLRGRAVMYRYEFHQGADHGYALPNRDVHDKRAANRDWEIIFAMFRRQLSSS